MSILEEFIGTNKVDDKNTSGESVEGKNSPDGVNFNLFEQGKVLASLFIVLNFFGVIVLVVIGINAESGIMVMYGLVAGAAGILFCILAIAVFSIYEEVNGMRDCQLETRDAQLKANQINEESMKYLRYMAKQLSDKSGK